MYELLSELLLSGYYIAFMPYKDCAKVKVVMRFKRYEIYSDITYLAINKMNKKDKLIETVLMDMKDKLEFKYENRRKDQ